MSANRLVIICCPASIYKVEQHQRLAKELVDHYPTREAWNHALGDRSGDLGDLYEFEMAFSSAITSFAPLIKSEKFREEREWRLISPILSYADAKFRTGNHVLIPYWEFDLDVGNTLRKIVVGPTPEPELSHLAVRGLLIKNGLPGVDQEINIVSSKISLKKV